jgi:hypothetical protein
LRGYIFGHSASVEVDIAITDTEHILIEIKSSASRGDVATLARLSEFYAKKTSAIPKVYLVSPFVEERAAENSF